MRNIRGRVQIKIFAGTVYRHYIKGTGSNISATRYADYKRSGIKFANSRARDSKPIQLVKAKDLKTIQTIIDKLTRYDTIIVGKKRLRVKFVRSTKRHEFAARVFFIPFWQGGLCLRQVALSLSVQPFTNIVGNYIRHNGDYNG